MIEQAPFGRTGHDSSRLIFGSYALQDATPGDADLVLEQLLAYGVDHVDTAPMYGKAEEHVGRWMDSHRDDFFLATKSRSRARDAAWANLRRSLERLRVDSIDLWQMHGLTNAAGWEKAMGPGGALEAFLEAREQGLVRFLGVTGHGRHVPEMHLRSLERHDFDSVMLPYNYAQMGQPRYRADFEALAAVCSERQVALQAIKAIAWQPCRKRSETYNTFFYEPLVEQDSIDKAVHWAMGLPDSFVVSVGDMELLPKVLDAASRYAEPPSDDEMASMAAELELRPVFA